MKLTYVKGIVVFGLILGLNYGMNKVLDPKIEHYKYHYTLSATQLDLKKGAIYTLSATGDDAAKINWISSDEDVATISNTGQIIAKKDGQTIISAKVHHESKDIIVNVYNTATQDVLIYNDSQTIAAASEVPSKTSIASFKMSLSKNKYTYDGKAKKPKVTIIDNNGMKLKKNTDYTIKYSHNRKAGTAKVIANGAGNYTGTLVGTFKISKAQEEEVATDSSVDTSLDDTATNDSTSSSVINNTPVTPVLTPTTNTTVTRKKTTTKPAETKSAEPTETKKKNTASGKNTTRHSSSSSKTSHNAAKSSDTTSSASNGTSRDTTAEDSTNNTASSSNSTGMSKENTANNNTDTNSTANNSSTSPATNTQNSAASESSSETAPATDTNQ